METYKEGDRLTYTYISNIMDPGFKEVEVTEVHKSLDQEGIALFYTVKSLQTNETKKYAVAYLINAYSKKD
jgi:hypothetical protein